MSRALIFILVLVTDLTWMWVQPAQALKDQRDADAVFSALSDLMGFAAPGRSLTWTNPETGHSGEVTALQPTTIEGRSCWDFERTYVDKVTMAVQGTACEFQPGFWQIVREGQPQPMTAAENARATAATQEEVLEAQTLLRRLQYDPGPADGLYGRQTQRAVMAYQRDRGLDQSGLVSDKLLSGLRQDAALLEPPETSSPPASEPAPDAASDDLPWLKEKTPPAESSEEELPWLKPKGDASSGVEVPPPPPAD